MALDLFVNSKSSEGHRNAKENMGLLIREMFGPDITDDFLQVLAALSEVNLTVDEAKKVFFERLNRGIRTYIAIMDGKLVGTASILIEQKFLHKGGKVAHIEDVAVHVDYQRKGIGTALVGYLVERAREAKCYKAILDCFEYLVPFYNKIGFKSFSVQMRYNLVDQD